MPSEEIMVEKYLYEWFLENDSLTVPDLGRFETEYAGVNIQTTIHKFIPPNKVFKFDPEIRENDNVFISYIAANELISPENAAKLIKQYVTALKIELGIQKKYKIKSFGTLLMNPDNSISFQTDEEVNYLGDSFGLPSLYSKPINRPQQDTFAQNFMGNTTNFNTAIEDEKLNKEDDLLIEEVVVNNSSRRLMWIVAMVLLVVSVGFAYLLITDQNPFSWQSSITTDNNEKIEENKTKPEKDDTTSSEEIEGKGQNDKITEEKKTTKEEVKVKKDISKEADNKVKLANSTIKNSFLNDFVYNPKPPAELNQILIKSGKSRFFVVLGSFDNSQNAYSFYNNLKRKGVSGVKIITPSSTNARHRVTYGEFNTRVEAANKGIEFASKRDVNFWILGY